MKNLILKNTIILLITNLIIRALGLLNRVILTRFLGEQGISLYTLILPTIMLFLSLSCFSLNTSIIKISSNNNSKKVISDGIIIAIISSSIASIVLLCMLKILCSNLLKQESAYFPILCSIPLFYLTSISSVLRGYLTGKEKMTSTSIANLLEQLSRMLFTILVFILIRKKEIITYIIYCILAMSIGELISIIFTSFIIIKNKLFCNDLGFDNKTKIKKEIFEISFPTTLNSLASNFTFFLEPIIYTFILTKLSVSSNEILLKYSEVTAYALPLISLFIFIPLSLSTAIMPKMTTASPSNIKNSIPKIITICLIPACLISTILYNYCDEILLVLYNTTKGNHLIKKYVWFFITLYFISPLNTILISRNQAKKVFIISIISHIIKLLIILIFPFFTNESLILSYLISNGLLFIIEYYILRKQFKFKIKINDIIRIILITIIINCISLILQHFNINYIIQIIIITLIYLASLFNIFRTNNK